MAPALLLPLLLSLTSALTSALTSSHWYRHKNFGELLAPSNMTLTAMVLEDCLLHCEHAQECVALTYIPGSGSGIPGECHLYDSHVTAATKGLSYRSGAAYFSTDVPGAGSCPQGYFQVSTGLRDACFQAHFLSKRKWEDARQACEQDGGHLALLTSLQENLAIRDHVLPQDPGAGAGRLFTGLTDRAVEGQYRWLDGSESSFYNWNSNPGLDTIKNCVIMRVDKGTWVPYDCDLNRPYLCEHRLV